MNLQLSKRPFGNSRGMRLMAVFLAAAYLAAGMLTLGMSLHHDGMDALGCRSYEAKAACMSDPGQHISWWTRAFVSTGAGQDWQALLSAMGTLLFLGFVVMAAFPPAPVPLRIRATSKDPPEGRFRDFLLEFFSQGTAQPLLYA